MGRKGYKIFSPGQIGTMTLPNRLVRSATWDASVVVSREMSAEVLGVYAELARGGIGLIITGGFPVLSEADGGLLFYEELRIRGLGDLADVVHKAAPDCKVVAQLETAHFSRGPSDVRSPFSREPVTPFTRDEISRIAESFAQAAAEMKVLDFDGVQLHGAHGSLLSQFLSPYTNRRDDDYGGSIENRARIVREIVAKARDRVGDFPILIKANATDYVKGGVDAASFPATAREVERAGVDAIEVSGGMWDCLVRPENELGFRPVPSPEAHTHIKRPEKQSYFLPYVESLDLSVPIILVGGNRDVERLEGTLQAGKVDFIALSRPFIREPDLPNRWREGRGRSRAACVSCNACLYHMYVHPGHEAPGLNVCVHETDREEYKAAKKWLASWVEDNIVV